MRKIMNIFIRTRYQAFELRPHSKHDWVLFEMDQVCNIYILITWNYKCSFDFCTYIVVCSSQPANNHDLISIISISVITVALS